MLTLAELRVHLTEVINSTEQSPQFASIDFTEIIAVSRHDWRYGITDGITEVESSDLEEEFINVCEYIYAVVSELDANHDYDKIQESINPILLQELRITPHSTEYGDDRFYLGTASLSRVYDILIGYTRVGIIDQLLEDIA